MNQAKSGHMPEGKRAFDVIRYIESPIFDITISNTTININTELHFKTTHHTPWDEFSEPFFLQNQRGGTRHQNGGFCKHDGERIPTRFCLLRIKHWATQSALSRKKRENDFGRIRTTGFFRFFMEDKPLSHSVSQWNNWATQSVEPLSHAVSQWNRVWATQSVVYPL